MHAQESASLRLTLLVIVLTVSVQRATADEPPLWLAVGRAGLIEAVAPLAEHRRREGFETAIATGSVEKAVSEATRPPTFLLLVGDDEPGQETAPWYLAASRRPLYRWRSVQREQFASDVALGDLDGDLVPDMAVGRIPARSGDEVELVVKKILAYEQQTPSERDLQLAVWTGSPGYGKAIDTMASSLLLGAVRLAGPKWAQPWIITGDPRHPLCGWPSEQPARFTRQMQQGGLLNVLMGHANAERFFSMAHDGQGIFYTAADAADLLAQGPPAAPMIVFSCESGNFARAKPCMAEAFLLMPGGPVAAVAATTESHPLTNYFSGQCLLTALGGKERRLGTLWLRAQRRAMKARNLLVEHVLRDVEGKLEEEINVEKLRRDQMLMYALLGDPATRLRMPEPLEATIEKTDDGWAWQAERPASAVRLQVGFRSAASPLPKPASDPDDRQQVQAVFEAANAALSFEPLPSPPDAGPWSGTLERPGQLRLLAVGERTIHVAVLQAE